MAFLFADGFDFYADAGDAQTRWASIQQDGRIVLATDTAFSAGQSLIWYLGVNKTWLAAWPSHESTIYFSVRLKYVADYHYDGDFLGMQVLDGTAKQVTLRFQIDGSIALCTGSSQGAVFATVPSAFSANAWDSWQVKLVISDTFGSVEIRKNGSATPLFSISNVNTRGESSNPTANTFAIFSPSGNNERFLIDDLFICSGSGGAPNTWPGDMRALQQLPIGAVQSQMAVTGAPSNWQALGQAHQDGDATYVASSTVGQEDIYSLSAIPATFAVVGVNYLVNWKKTDAGSRTAQLSVSANGSADTALVTNPALSNTYAYSSAYLASDPSGAAWTPASASAALLGVKIAA